jgi:hypothetical protein
MTQQSSDHANGVQNRRKRKITPEDTEVILDGSNDAYDNDACNDTHVCDESDTADVDMNAVIDIGSNSCSDDTTTDDDDDDASGILWLQHQSTASSSLPATTAFTINEHIMIQYFQTAIQSHDYTEAQFLNLDDSVVTTSASPRCCTTNNGSSDGGTNNNNNNNVLSSSTHKEQQQQANDHAVQLWTPNELDLPLWAVVASTMAPLSKMPGSL